MAKYMSIVKPEERVRESAETRVQRLHMSYFSLPTGAPEWLLSSRERAYRAFAFAPYNRRQYRNRDN